MDKTSYNFRPSQSVIWLVSRRNDSNTQTAFQLKKLKVRLIWEIWWNSQLKQAPSPPFFWWQHSCINPTRSSGTNFPLALGRFTSLRFIRSLSIKWDNAAICFLGAIKEIYWSSLLSTLEMKSILLLSPKSSFCIT